MAKTKPTAKLNTLTIPGLPVVPRGLPPLPPGITVPEAILVPKLPPSIFLKAWSAWHDKQPGVNKNTLHIRGVVRVDTLMATVTLEKYSPSASIPENIYFRVKILQAGPSPFIPGLFPAQVNYAKKHVGLFTSAVITLPDGKIVQVPIQIVQ